MFGFNLQDYKLDQNFDFSSSDNKRLKALKINFLESKKEMKGIIFNKLHKTVVRDGDESATSGITRRLSMDTRSNNVPRISNRNHINTIHAFGEGGFLEPFMMGQLSSKSCLKVLELEGTSLNYAPSNLRNLVHLSRNYQAEFSVLGFTIGVLVKKGIKNLTSLEILTHVELDDKGINLIQEMRMLNMLRKLGLRRVRREYGNVICALAVEMTHQESLNITAIKIIKLESLCKLMRVL
ncbi:hypothetical protein JHK85_010142 [Glycine max]|nr:hypothetical protein JHK85_010142 [Glycine max]